MNSAIIRSLASVEGLIYFVLVLVGIVFLFRLWRAWREMQGALFGLERELASRRLSQAVAVLAIIGALAIGEFMLATFIAPALPASSVLSTPTLDLLTIPTGTLPPEFMTAVAAASQAAPITGTTGCLRNRLEISTPKPGAEVTGQIELVGSVNIDNFGFYKYEFSLAGTQVWSTIQAGNEIKKNEPLGLWDTTLLAPGDYLLRLVATDNDGVSLEPCVISVRVVVSE